MGHVVNKDKEHRLLQRRLDGMATGAPASPALMQILKLLFSPEEAALARRIPGRPTPVRRLAETLDMPAEALDEKLTELAARGVVLDFYHRSRRYAMLPPVVIGFFEFVFMRARDDLPMAELAALFDQYMYNDSAFAHGLFQGQTQVGRSLVREEALPEEDRTEVLDWERASKLVENASAVGVSMCACRHKAMHLDHACDAPMDVCMSLNAAAETMARNGIARKVSTREGMRILEESKAAGLAQTGDNVQRGVTYICNCCGCCCGMMNAITKFDMPHAVVSSNWITEVDAAACNGCGKCAAACPVHAIEMQPIEDGTRRKRAAVDAERCLGCGVCYGACNTGGIRLRPRERRVFTPESTYARVVNMAIERGKLAELIFDDPDSLSYRTVGRVLRVLERTPPAKAALAVKPLRSTFINMLLKGAGA